MNAPIIYTFWSAFNIYRSGLNNTNTYGVVLGSTAVILPVFVIYMVTKQWIFAVMQQYGGLKG